MAIPLFLAARPEEITETPQHYAWMACHFFQDGLTPLPKKLPAGAMLVLDDALPPKLTDPQRVVYALATAAYDGLILDFQRPDDPLTQQIATAIVENARCPVGVSEPYAHDLNCAVFLSPPPPNQPLPPYLQPWQGREIWLDLAPSPTRITLTESGSRTTHLSRIPAPESSFRDKELFCHYRAEIGEKEIHFDIWRTKEDLYAILEAGASMGITRGIGLYQELTAL